MQNMKCLFLIGFKNYMAKIKVLCDRLVDTSKTKDDPKFNSSH